MRSVTLRTLAAGAALLALSATSACAQAGDPRTRPYPAARGCKPERASR